MSLIPGQSSEVRTQIVDVKRNLKQKTRTTSGIPEEVLNDLCSRFIVNTPEETSGFIRVAFQIELAHWFYIDNWCMANPSLPAYKLKEFFSVLFKYIPKLRKYECFINEIYNEWRRYKKVVPTFGAIILDETLSHVLLVQSYTASSWGFPKGKINQEENPVRCACREVLEETGIDISRLINDGEYVETIVEHQLTRLYYIVGVKTDAVFSPQTKNEIKNIKWFPLDQLPQKNNKNYCRLEKTSFYLVSPFTQRILNWVELKKITAGIKHEQEQCIPFQMEDECPASICQTKTCENRKRITPTVLYTKSSTQKQPNVIAVTKHPFQSGKYDSGDIINVGIPCDQKVKYVSEIEQAIRHKVRSAPVNNEKDFDLNHLRISTWVNFTLDKDALMNFDA